VLDRTILEIQEAYSLVTDPALFADLLAQEKKGKKRKVLKRWLKERMKACSGPKSFLVPTHIEPSFMIPPVKQPIDSITGIPIIG